MRIRVYQRPNVCVTHVRINVEASLRPVISNNKMIHEFYDDKRVRLFRHLYFPHQQCTLHTIFVVMIWLTPMPSI
jgi:hypothetical protein